MIYNSPSYWLKTTNKIPVTITGSGEASNGRTMSYVEIGGIKYIEEKTDLLVKVGATIVLCVIGISPVVGKISIDGENVLNSSGTNTYEYSVPSNISNIAIVLGANAKQGTITVTTS